MWLMTAIKNFYGQVIVIIIMGRLRVIKGVRELMEWLGSLYKPQECSSISHQPLRELKKGFGRKGHSAKEKEERERERREGL